MKYILFFIGVVLGNLLASAFIDSSIIQWIISGILGLIFYSIPSFIRYSKSTPKQILEFHGPDAPITKSNSFEEVRTIIYQLHKGGLIREFEPLNPNVVVDEEKWVQLSKDNLITLSQILMRSCQLSDDNISEIIFLNPSGNKIARYSATGELVRES